MNTSLKHWKEAATLILAAGRRLGADKTLTRTPVGAPEVPPGRAPGPPPAESTDSRLHSHVTSRFDYDVLLLKRSSKSGFMPNAYVFPGGVVDSSDFSRDWLDIFKAFRGSRSFGLRTVNQPAGTRPPIFATDRLGLGSPIPGEVAFRICALRETFEESGILLVVPSSSVGSNALQKLEEEDSSLGRMDTNLRHYKVCSQELVKWRTLVNQDPSNFIRMCRELQVLPNIWALHEWGNWLTPRGRYGATRFDTAFFICCLQDTPHTLQDHREIVHFKWSTPSEVLQSYQDRSLWIAPPQVYELSRLSGVSTLKELHDFSRRRATEGCERWLPVVSLKDDCYTSLLPGDRCYPSDPSSLEDPQEGPREDPKECSDSALHRIVTSDPYTVTLQVTVKPKYKHLHPVSHSKSQL